MDVSENGGFSPKSSILIGISITNHPFWGTPIFGNTHICKIICMYIKNMCICTWYYVKNHITHYKLWLFNSVIICFFNIVTLLISTHILYLRTRNKGLGPIKHEPKGIPNNQESYRSLNRIHWRKSQWLMVCQHPSGLSNLWSDTKTRPENINPLTLNPGLFFQHPKSMGLWYLYIIPSKINWATENHPSSPIKIPPNFNRFLGPRRFSSTFFWLIFPTTETLRGCRLGRCTIALLPTAALNATNLVPVLRVDPLGKRAKNANNIWVFPKMVGFPPKSSILIGGVHFGGKPLFLEIPFWLVKNLNTSYGWWQPEIRRMATRLGSWNPMIYDGFD